MANVQCEATLKRLRIYLGLFYLIMLYGTFCMYMHEYFIMRHMNQPINRWFFDVWYGIGPMPKLYMVITFYITLHLLGVGIITLIRRAKAIKQG